MPLVEIEGVPVDFPFEPYSIQKDYMAKVLRCIKNETNGVLESPTGTGKTLSLLCATLAWIELKKAQCRVENSEKNIFCGEQTNENNRVLSVQVPRVIYASRTHSQLSQAISELKRTSYKHLRACVLGSRDQLCIHPELVNENHSMKVQMCTHKVRNRSCQYHSRTERMKENTVIGDKNIMDIEDLVKLGTGLRFCPYYMAKELDKRADIIFMPYNYLIDHNIVKNLSTALDQSIVILDEAHNIERICEESASIQLKSSDITLAIEEVTATMKMISEPTVDLDVEVSKDINPDDLCNLKELLLDLEKEIDAVPVGGSEGTTFEGTYLSGLFQKLKYFNVIQTTSLINSVTEFLTTVGDGPFARKGIALKSLEEKIKLIFMGSTPDFWKKVDRCYKVYVQVEQPKTRTMKDNWLTKVVEKSTGKVINYWCFSPGFGMEMLMKYSLRCLILTSGTLAPLGPFISELEVKVGEQLENPHIIKGDQVCVRIVHKGPDSETLNCNFRNRDNPKYIQSVGMTISNLTRMIPGGVLIFFPSYPIMLQCKKEWEQSGLWATINQMKTIYVEPREKEAFSSAMQSYYSSVREHNGAIFMGVCRGKVSEGLDFVDANGRAVIIIGLPYPPYKDPRIVLKRRYMDACYARDKEYVKGDDWYSLEATRAVNQAIGRVIRHANDYGAIILLDTRFDNFRVKSQMSLWLREHIKVVKNFGELIRDIRSFFADKSGTFKQSVSTSNAGFSSSITPHHTAFDFGPNPKDLSSSASSLATTSAYPVDCDAGEVNIQPRKKMKIVLVSNSNSSKPKETSVQEYILMIQKILDVKSFQQFIKALSDYKQSEDYDELVSELDDIFKGKRHLRYLIEGLGGFLRPEHKVAFRHYCDKR